MLSHTLHQKHRVSRVHLALGMSLPILPLRIPPSVPQLLCKLYHTYQLTFINTNNNKNTKSIASGHRQRAEPHHLHCSSHFLSLCPSPSPSPSCFQSHRLVHIKSNSLKSQKPLSSTSPCPHSRPSSKHTHEATSPYRRTLRSQADARNDETSSSSTVTACVTTIAKHKKTNSDNENEAMPISNSESISSAMEREGVGEDEHDSINSGADESDEFRECMHRVVFLLRQAQTRKQALHRFNNAYPHIDKKRAQGVIRKAVTSKRFRSRNEVKDIINTTLETNASDEQVVEMLVEALVKHVHERMETIMEASPATAPTSETSPVYAATTTTSIVTSVDADVDDFTGKSVTSTMYAADEIAREMSKQSQSLDSYLARDSSGRIVEDSVLSELSDLSEPHDEYALARTIDRQIIVHTGNTNSGKTYQAIKRLQQAASGVYCGPLRLLAAEIYDKMTAKGVLCNLRTGQDVISVPGAQHISSTVEMVNTDRLVDVAVIDEAQMMSDANRGAAWTRAILGVPAKEVHVCGDLSIVSIMKEIAALTGEALEIREYRRLTELKLSPSPSAWKSIRPGDCIVAFSRRHLFAIKQQVESQTKFKCCIIYGSLPPDTRRAQAALFNDPKSGYNVLVASDAVGMGLNLRIGRIIFSSLYKYDGSQIRMLQPTEVKQIAGRAGRYGSEFNVGYVCSLYREDQATLKKLLQTPLPDTSKAGLEPSLRQIELFAAKKPAERLSSLYAYFAAYATIDPLYFVVDLEERMAISDALQHIDLSIKDRYLFSLSPVNTKRVELVSALVKLGEAFSLNREVTLDVLKPLPNLLKTQPRTPQQVEQLELQWLIYDLYIWLANRYEDGRFVDKVKAEAMRDAIALHITESIEIMNIKGRKQIRNIQNLQQRRREELLLKKEMQAAVAFNTPQSQITHQEEEHEETIIDIPLPPNGDNALSTPRPHSTTKRIIDIEEEETDRYMDSALLSHSHRAANL